MKQVILITGASAGMGKTTALLLLQKGYTVYAAARRTDKMQDLKQAGANILLMDVADEHSMVTGVNTILQNEDKIDILINNAGFGSYGTIEDVSIAEAKYQLDVNLFGAARLIQLVLPKMRENKFGKILNISSIGGKFATPYGGWYHASKFALEGLSDSLRNEVKQFGIDVIIIEPGGVKSEWATIAYDNLVKRSVNSVYKKTIDKLADFMKSTLAKNAEPIVIAELILKAIEAKKPKFRYIGGYMAKPALTARKLLSDRLFDKMIMSQMK
jgi:short-subunit dehydrogenase